MSKLLAILATLKAILIAASVAFARGDMLPVILISILFNLAQLGEKPVGQAVPRDYSAQNVYGFPRKTERSCARKRDYPSRQAPYFERSQTGEFRPPDQIHAGCPLAM
jgi:hypothetical protein